MTTAELATADPPPTVLLSQPAAAHVAIVTLNRPAARNALNRALVAALREVLETLAGQADLRAVILAGAGPAFCAGADLKERQTLTAPERTWHTRAIADLTDQLAALPMPVIAALHGFALAGGAELAVACDLRIATADATLGFPEVKIGIFPGAGGVYRLPRLVGLGLARELLYTGRSLTATEALQRGLVDQVVPAAELLPAALTLAEGIEAAAPLAVRAVKLALADSAGLPDPAARHAVDAHRAPLDATADYGEGLAAFAARRPPRFTGT